MKGHEFESGAVQVNRRADRFQVHYEPTLVEEVVLLAVAGQPVERDFRRERNPIYEEQDPERREAGFRSFHGIWFARLGLAHPVAQALDERPSLRTSTRCCLVAAAHTRKEETAELFVSPPGQGVDEVGRRSIGLRLRPDSFLNAEFLVALLRHEFLHVADMLDPAFEYAPDSLHVEDETTPTTVLQERYRAMWDATIDGRLVRKEMAPATRRSDRLADFAGAFPMFCERTEEAFIRFFDESPHTHSELVAYAHSPADILCTPSLVGRRS